jgi:glutamate racemase
LSVSPIGSFPDAGLPIGSLIDAALPIGVFDSGVGGLSILNALRRELPHEDFVYFADNGHAPYGERSDAYVAERSREVTRHLLDGHRIKALVVACNTATAAAIHQLRADHPGLPLVGVEPALKPAVAASRTGHIAVIATRVTLESRKFEALQASLAGQAHFSIVACDGLAGAIERSDEPQIAALCEKYLAAAGRFGSGPGQIDTLVLGCTHYPFVSELLRRHAGDAVRFIDTGAPVAQQTRRLLAAADRLNADARDGRATLHCSAAPEALDAAAARWLELPAGRATRTPAALAAST